MEISELKQNIQRVQASIGIAAAKRGDGHRVLLVGASKTMSQDIIDLVDSGKLLTTLGENRAQELRDKYREGQSFLWHYIGALQENKIKYLIGKVALIESVDSLDIAQKLQGYCYKKSTTCDILLQVNMGKEEAKHGFLPEEIDAAIQCVSLCGNLNIKGIMVVMPISDEDNLINLYKQVDNMYTELKSKYSFLQYLSAGMTNDYMLAIQYGGANIVRVGRAIFGERTNYIQE